MTQPARNTAVSVFLMLAALEIWVNAAWKVSAQRDVVAKEPRWRGIKVIPLDLTIAQRYQEVANKFQQIFKPHGG